MFAWRGWSNPIFVLQGSEVTSCLSSSLAFEVSNGLACEVYSCERVVVKCVHEDFTSYDPVPLFLKF